MATIFSDKDRWKLAGSGRTKGLVAYYKEVNNFIHTFREQPTLNLSAEDLESIYFIRITDAGIFGGDNLGFGGVEYSITI